MDLNVHCWEGGCINQSQQKQGLQTVVSFMIFNQIKLFQCHQRSSKKPIFKNIYSPRHSQLPKLFFMNKNASQDITCKTKNRFIPKTWEQFPKNLVFSFCSLADFDEAKLLCNPQFFKLYVCFQKEEAVVNKGCDTLQ